MVAGTTTGMLAVRSLDDQLVEPTEAFTVTLPADPLIEMTEATATGWIENDDTARVRQRGLGVVLAGVERARWT